MQVSGPSGCGKTLFVKDLLCDPESPFDRILYFYAQSQPLYYELPTGTVFIEGLPEEASEFDQALNHCFVFDDLADEVITRICLSSPSSKKSSGRETADYSATISPCLISCKIVGLSTP